MIAIVDYRAGNLTSVQHAVKSLGLSSLITSDRDAIMGAGRVIFPGVGAAGAAMESLRESGLDKTLREYAATGKPLLGICVGAQVILNKSAEGLSAEDGGVSCLGLLPGEAKRFESTATSPIKIPQIGWNQVHFKKNHPLFAGLPGGDGSGENHFTGGRSHSNGVGDNYFYFVHSYYPVPARREDVWAETAYGDTVFASIIGRDNLMACQFHVEKSGKPGLSLLKNFSTWDGRGPESADP